MSDLTEFLLARVAEDEAVALDAAAITGLGWRQSTSDVDGEPRGGVEVALDEWGMTDTVVYDECRPSVEEAAHIAHWDPARVLAECEAKRKVVELHTEGVDYDQEGNRFSTGCNECGGDTYMTVVPWPCPTLRYLAQPYADHPDFREEWRA